MHPKAFFNACTTKAVGLSQSSVMHMHPATSTLRNNIAVNQHLQLEPNSSSQLLQLEVVELNFYSSHSQVEAHVYSC